MNALLTGTEYRHNSRERVKKYKEDMLEKGYTQFLCYISADMKAEIARLKDLNGWNNIEALEHIFNVYMNVNTNKSLQPTPDTLENGLIEFDESLLTENVVEVELNVCHDSTDTATNFTESDSLTDLVTKNIDTIFNPALEWSTENRNSEYKAWVFDIIEKLYKKSFTYARIKAELEKHGVKTIRGLNVWSIGTIGKILKPRKK